MEIFPTGSYKFKLINEENETLERLNRRTEKSETLSTIKTDKSFIGIIKGKEFRIISSEIGRGAFCVISGKIENDFGHVNVEINKGFKKLFYVFYILSPIGMIASYFSEPKNFSFFLIIVCLLQILMIRFFFIEIFYRRFSKHSLSKLRDALDTENMEKV